MRSHKQWTCGVTLCLAYASHSSVCWQWSFNQPDSVEGVQSFLEKRPPQFRNTGELPDDFPWWKSVDVKPRL